MQFVNRFSVSMKYLIYYYSLQLVLQAAVILLKRTVLYPLCNIAIRFKHLKLIKLFMLC